MAAGTNNMSAMAGLPPRYPKPPTGTWVIRNQNSSSSSSTCLNNEETAQGVLGDCINFNNGERDMKLISSDDDDVIHPSLVVDLKLKKIENPSSFCPSLNGHEVETASDGSIKSEPNNFYRYKWTREIEPNMDPKRKKRILANRLSAQRYRLRKMEYIAELERTVTALQADVSLMIPQVSKYDHKLSELIIENNGMKQRLATLATVKQYKEAQSVILTEERDWLRDILRRQQQVLLQLQPSMSLHQALLR